MNRSEAKDLALVLAVAFLASLAWCLTKGPAIEGDDAIMGLMSLKISQGIDFPVFFWQAHYSGPIASYLAAPLHWFFKPSPMVLHSVIVPIHLFYSAGMYFLARAWLGQREAMIAGLFAALPGQLFPYSALGGFTESMAFAPWMMFFCLGRDTVADGDRKRNFRILAGGFLCGFALWVFPVVLPVVLACIFFVERASGKGALKRTILGCLLGLAPLILYNVAKPGATILRLLSRPIAMDRNELQDLVASSGALQLLLQSFSKWLLAVYHTLLNLPFFTVSLFGLDNSETTWNFVTGIVSLIALIAGIYFCLYEKRENRCVPLALFATVALNYGFVLFFGMDRPRYLIPSLIVVPFGLTLIITQWLYSRSHSLGAFAVMFILVLNGLSVFSSPRDRYPDYLGLTRFLASEGLTRGYAPYISAYPLVYLSDEELIYTPAFHEPEYDRHAKYTALVTRAENPAFIFADQASANHFRLGLKDLNTSSKERTCGPFRIFHDLTPNVDMERLRSVTHRQAN
jgi:hypothetical protein